MAQKRKASVSEETFDEFLAEQRILEACEDHAVKELIAEQLAAAMAEQGLTKVEMAARMKTSRRQLDRLFDPAVPSVTLDTLRRAASAVGRSLRIDLVWHIRRSYAAAARGFDIRNRMRAPRLIA